MSTVSPDPAELGAKVHRLFTQGWSHQDYDGLTGVVADSATFHIQGQTRQTGFEDMVQLVAMWHRTFRDFRASVDDVVADGDRVAARLTFTGTHVGPWRDVAPTNRPVEFTAMMFFRFEGGQIVEIWEEYDEVGLRRQLTEAT